LNALDFDVHLKKAKLTICVEPVANVKAAGLALTVAENTEKQLVPQDSDAINDIIESMERLIEIADGFSEVGLFCHRDRAC